MAVELTSLISSLLIFSEIKLSNSITLFVGILGHDIFVDENGEVEFNYTVLEKRGGRKYFKSFLVILVTFLDLHRLFKSKIFIVVITTALHSFSSIPLDKNGNQYVNSLLASYSMLKVPAEEQSTFSVLLSVSSFVMR